jgi:hypothetical protein
MQLILLGSLYVQRTISVYKIMRMVIGDTVQYNWVLYLYDSLLTIHWFEINEPKVVSY